MPKNERIPVRPAILPFCMAVLLSFCLPVRVQAQEQVRRGYHTLYADVLYDHPEDLERFTVDIGRGLGFWSESPRKNPRLTGRRVDELVQTVMKLLDMHVQEFRVTIKLYPGRKDLERTYRMLGMTGTVPPAFYAHSLRTIHVSVRDISDRILAHEIAHALISAYFIPPPPARIQEVLAQYVDAHLDDE